MGLFVWSAVISRLLLRPLVLVRRGLAQEEEAGESTRDAEDAVEGPWVLEGLIVCSHGA